MVDVFVLAIFVVMAKGLPGKSVQVSLQLRWGGYFFIASIVAGMVLTTWTRRLLVEDFRASLHPNAGD